MGPTKNVSSKCERENRNFLLAHISKRKELMQHDNNASIGIVEQNILINKNHGKYFSFFTLFTTSKHICSLILLYCFSYLFFTLLIQSLYQYTYFYILPQMQFSPYHSKQFYIVHLVFIECRIVPTIFKLGSMVPIWS